MNAMDEIIARAAAKADADCLKAIEESEAALVTAPDYVVSGFENREHYVIPVRSLATGMLAHIKRSYERNHQ